MLAQLITFQLRENDRFMTTDKRREIWQLAAKDLGLEIVAPFPLLLPSGKQVDAEVLLKNFGAEKGMLIINEYGQVALLVNEIINEGYGFSVIEKPKENETYKREEFIELLNEWSWSGAHEKCPAWIKH